MTNKSKFGNIFENRKKSTELKLSSSETTQPAKKKVGRPKGKKSNPDYSQVGILLLNRNYSEARKHLIDRKGVSFSDVMNKLLEEWLRTNAHDDEFYEDLPR